ncbi:MAG: hypothetical protein Q8P49_04540 [Candidatus Liptonbacteria bacterium]|nr:hypothetical protein [Candidatus Liptonbacteria bacterium]
MKVDVSTRNMVLAFVTIGIILYCVLVFNDAKNGTPAAKETFVVARAIEAKTGLNSRALLYSFDRPDMGFNTTLNFLSGGCDVTVEVDGAQAVINVQDSCAHLKVKAGDSIPVRKIRGAYYWPE